MSYEEKGAPELDDESPSFSTETTSGNSSPSAISILAGCNVCGVAGMIASIEWLNQEVQLWPSSPVIQTVIEIWKSFLPPVIREKAKDIPPHFIIVLWVIATTIFSATLVGYLMDNRERTVAWKLSWIRIVVVFCVSIVVVGATAEELFLVFTPLTIGGEMALSFLGAR